MTNEQASRTTPKKEEGKSNTVNIIIVILLVVILAGGAYFLLASKDDSNGGGTEPTPTEAPTSTPSPTSTPTPAPTPPLEDRVELVNLLMETTRPYLTESEAADLDMLQAYINTNPEVLDNPESAPAEVQAAFKNIESKLSAVGVAMGVKRDFKVGDRHMVVGIITKIDEGDEVTQITYKVTDANDGADYYFIFTEDIAQEIDETMLDQTVAVEIEITKVNEDGTYSYKVITNPVLFEPTPTPTGTVTPIVTPTVSPSATPTEN